MASIPRSRSRSTAGGVITNYVAAGAGVAVVPDQCLTDHDGLRKIRFPDVLPPRKYGAITRRCGPISLCARRFLEIMAAGEQGRARRALRLAVDRKRIYHKRHRLRQLRAFCRVARLSSFTQAAESLGVGQSSVSIQVRELGKRAGDHALRPGGSGSRADPRRETTLRARRAPGTGHGRAARHAAGGVRRRRAPAGEPRPARGQHGGSGLRPSPVRRTVPGLEPRRSRGGEELHPARRG